MKRYYPVNLNLSGKKCLVAGGGKVAQRKIRRLLDFGADVWVVSPHLTKTLKGWAAEGKIRVLCGKYRPALLAGCRLVFAVTNRLSVNRKIAREALRRGIWVNVAKPGELSDFILPAYFESEGFLISVSTHGRAPRRAKQMSQELAKSKLFSPR